MLKDGGKKAPSSRGPGATATNSRETIISGDGCCIFGGDHDKDDYPNARSNAGRAEATKAVVEVLRLVRVALRSGRRRRGSQQDPAEPKAYSGCARLRELRSSSMAKELDNQQALA